VRRFSIVEEQFQSIEVSNSIDVVIEQSDETGIMVEADDNLQIITTVENGILVISCDETYFINTEVMKVTVKMPVIEQLSSDASITSKNTIKEREYSTKHIKCCDNRSHYRGG
jgi:hypothetical protein